MEKLSREHKQMVTEAINNWLDSSNPERSQNKLASASNVNPAYISRIKEGIYTADAGRDAQSPIGDSAFNKLADFLDVKFEGGLYWPTIRNYMRIEKICKKAHRMAKNFILDAPTGQGKTFTLEKVSKRTEYVVYVKCTMNMSAKNLVDAILEKLHVTPPSTSIHDKLKVITKITISKRYLIIIDEAEVVKPGIYAVIKDIMDAIKDRSGMVVSGFGLIKKLEKLALKEKPGFPQLKRRLFGNVEELGVVSDTEIIEVCANEGITNKGAQNVIASQCSDLDKLSQWISDIKDWQKQEGKKITGEEVIRLFSVKGLNMKIA